MQKSKRIYQKNNKPVIHCTDLMNYAICPRLSQLSRQISIEPNEAMLTGLIIERLVLGDKDNQLDSLLKRKRDSTIENFKKQAEYIKQKINPIETFYRIEIEQDKYYLTGEIDFIEHDSLCDLKTTKKLSSWIAKNNYLELLQGYFYPYLYYLKHKEYKPFIYYIYSLDLQILKKIIIKHPEEKFDFIEKLIRDYIEDPFYPANFDACLNANGYGTCLYLNYCKEALEKLEEPIIIEDVNIE